MSGPASPARSMSPTWTAKREATRYGVVKTPDIKFGDEERFRWQQSKSTNDCAYNLPEMTMTRSVKFGHSLRKGMDDENPDNKKRSTGPGSYEFASCYDHLSEFAKHEANRFACAPRQSMAVKTPSPGAVYNIEKQYSRGPEKSTGIGFPNASRQPLYNKSASMNADLYLPRPNTGRAITMAGKIKPKHFSSSSSPGPVYDAHKVLDFRTGPQYSFGKGKGDRFKAAGFLPDLQE